VLVRAPWLGYEAAAVDLFTPGRWSRAPAALALGLILQRLPARRAGARGLRHCCFRPAVGRARPWTDCNQQNREPAQLQNMPRATGVRRAVAYNHAPAGLAKRRRQPERWRRGCAGL